MPRVGLCQERHMSCRTKSAHQRIITGSAARGHQRRTRQHRSMSRAQQTRSKKAADQPSRSRRTLRIGNSVGCRCLFAARCHTPQDLATSKTPPLVAMVMVVVMLFCCVGWVVPRNTHGCPTENNTSTQRQQQQQQQLAAGHSFYQRTQIDDSCKYYAGASSQRQLYYLFSMFGFYFYCSTLVLSKKITH